MTTSWSARAVSAAFVLALGALGAYAAWPMYRTAFEVVTVAGALVLGTTLAVVGVWQKWGWLTLALVSAAAYLVFGVVLAIPSALVTPMAFLSGYRKLVTATVLSWKELVTIALPLGTYQTLLVPLYFVTLAATISALTLVWRFRHGALLASAIMFAPLVFALAFGSSAMSAPLKLGPWTMRGPRETAEGVIALLLAAALVRWRMVQQRSAGLRSFAEQSGIRHGAGGTTGRLRRLGFGVLVAVVAVVVAVPIGAAASGTDSPQVLRKVINPSGQLASLVSPLTTYRESFTATAYNTPLLTVHADTSGALTQLPRLRLATLSYYDGTQFSVTPPATAGGTSGTAVSAGQSKTSLAATVASTSEFAHIPSLVNGQGTGRAQLTVTTSGYTGVWAPTVTGLGAVSFGGTDAQNLQDGFYYNQSIEAGVELASLDSGDTLTLSATPAASTTLAQLGKPARTNGLIPASDIPASLTQWVKSQDVSSDANGLATLIARLRARGYLSHSLQAPTAGSGTSWLTALGGAQFAPSTAGESVDRINQIFTSLNQRQQQIGGSNNAQLVAAVGDDEQFATAAAMLASELGFPARVVLGFPLSPTVTDSQSIPACKASGSSTVSCSGQNLTAWVEIQGADGSWIDVTTTPQHTDPLSPTITHQREPQIETQANPRNATEQQPPQANPGTGNSKRSNTPAINTDLGLWLAMLHGAEGGLLILVGVMAPFVAILTLKAARRRSRRRVVEPAESLAAGWDELRDAAVDLGLPGLPRFTRREQVRVWQESDIDGAHDRSGRTGLEALADRADAAVFGIQPLSESDVDTYWAGVDTEVARLSARATRWRRVWARLSLASFAFRRAKKAQIRKDDAHGYFV